MKQSYPDGSRQQTSREIPIFRDTSSQQQTPNQQQQSSSGSYVPDNVGTAREIPIIRQSNDVPRSGWPNQQSKFSPGGYRSSDRPNDSSSNNENNVDQNATSFSSHPVAAAGVASRPAFNPEPAHTNVSPPPVIIQHSDQEDGPRKPSPPIVELQQPPASDLPDGQPLSEPKSDGLTVEQPRRGRSPSPAPPNLTPLEVIELIMEEADQHKQEVDDFEGKRTDKQYIVLEEMLTRLLIKLDRIDSEGKPEIRQARRDAVRNVQSLMDMLDSKAASSAVSGKAEQDRVSAGNESGKKPAKNPASVKEMTLGSEVQC